MKELPPGDREGGMGFEHRVQPNTQERDPRKT